MRGLNYTGIVHNWTAEKFNPIVSKV